MIRKGCFVEEHAGDELGCWPVDRDAMEVRFNLWAPLYPLPLPDYQNSTAEKSGESNEKVENQLSEQILYLI